jgi:quercetin dioxygenase-like cupin family protein
MSDMQHHFSDNLYAKEIILSAGSLVIQHKHKFDHLSILAKGKVIVLFDEDAVEYTAPACINIVKGVDHAIKALEDSVWFCVHATDETDATKVDEVLIQEGN